MKVLIVHRYFWPESMSTLPVMLKDVVHMHLERGDSVGVVTGARAEHNKSWNDEFGDSVHIKAFYADIDRNVSYIQRTINLVRLYFLSFGKIISDKPEVVYTVSYPPLLSSLLAFTLRLISRKSKQVFYVQDILSYRISNSIVRALYERMFKYSCKRSFRTITLSGEMRSEVLRIVGTTAENNKDYDDKIAVIPNFSPDLYTTVLERVEKRYDVVYAGNHGEAQNLGHFLRTLAVVQKKKSVKVVFYGEGTSKTDLMQLAEEVGAVVEFNESVSRLEVSRKMMEAKLGLVGAVPDLMRYAFPSKLAAYNSAGVAGLVMCESDSETADWLAENGIGVPIDSTDMNKAAEQIERAIDLHFDPVAVRSAAERLYSLDGYIALFKIKILKSF